MSSIRRLWRALAGVRPHVGPHYVEPANDVTRAIDAGTAPAWGPTGAAPAVTASATEVDRPAVVADRGHGGGRGEAA